MPKSKQEKKRKDKTTKGSHTKRNIQRTQVDNTGDLRELTREEFFGILKKVSTSYPSKKKTRVKSSQTPPTAPKC